jgi:hypothetical protein
MLDQLPARIRAKVSTNDEGCWIWGGASDGSTILRETLFCRCGHEEHVVQGPRWTVEDVKRRVAIVRGKRGAA